MKNYASKRAKHGKLAYRTPSSFRFQNCKEVSKNKLRYRNKINRSSGQ